MSLVAQATFDHAATTNDTLTYSSVGGGSGSLMLLLITRSGGTSTGALSSVTDSASNTWTLATRGAVSGGTNTRIEAWYTYNYAAVTSISLNSTASQYYATSLTEWSGIQTSSDPKDVVSTDGSGQATTSAPATPSITTTAQDLVVTAIHCAQTTATFNGAGSSPTSGWTSLTNFDSTTAASGRAAYIVGGAASYSGAWSLGASKNCGEVSISFKAAPTAVTQTGSDVGSGTDAATVTSIEPGADTGSGADTATQRSTAVAADTGSGAEAQAMIIQASDSGSGVDNGGQLVTQAGSDVGSGSESAQTTMIQAETASGTDSASVTGSEAGSDTGSGADNAQTTVLQADSGSGVDAAVALVQAADTGSGADSATWTQTWTVGDTGSGVDTGATQVKNNNVANPRRVVIAADARIVAPNAENRLTSAAADARTVAPTAESRVAAVAADSRVYTMTGVDSGS